MQDYSYALDANMELVHANDAVKSSHYTCPCCEQEMRPIQGEKRKKHFRHKQSVDCNSETYLHKISKILIRKKFLESEHFYIAYDALHVCDEECPINKNDRCSAYIQKTIDLKTVYDICCEEASINNFVADLLLSSSSSPNRQKTLIEIYVKHKSTIDKIESGNRIIEIKVWSESDIQQIIDDGCIKGNNNNNKSNHIFSNCVFYNFNKEFSINKVSNCQGLMYVYCAKKDGTIFKKEMKCNESIEDLITAGYNVLCSSDSVNWKWVLYKFHENGINIKNCILCRYYHQVLYGRSFCSLYKKFGTPQKPKTNLANSCQYYRFNEISQNEIKPVANCTMNVVYWDNIVPSFKIFLAKKINYND